VTRSEAAYLRDGIYQLHTKHGGVNYHMLYFLRVALRANSMAANMRRHDPEGVRNATVAFTRCSRASIPSPPWTPALLRNPIVSAS
jgi:hypothetical protein